MCCTAGGLYIHYVGCVYVFYTGISQVQIDKLKAAAKETESTLAQREEDNSIQFAVDEAKSNAAKLAAELALAKNAESRMQTISEEASRENAELKSKLDKTNSQFSAAQAQAARAEAAYTKLQNDTAKADKDVRIRLAGKLQVSSRVDCWYKILNAAIPQDARKGVARCQSSN